MCGRFVLAISGEAIAASMDAAPLLPAFVEALAAWQGRFNITPASMIPVVRAAAGDAKAGRGREIVFMRWGLVPFWAKEPSIGSRLTNARSDSLASKPAFREAWKRRRCLIPATAFYEWHTPSGGGAKEPYAIASAHGEVLSFGGIWERWRDPTDPHAAELLTVAIMTTDANGLMRPIHDRMPVLVPPEARDQWLDAGVVPSEALSPWLTPAPEGVLRAWRVSSMVNNARNDRPGCLEPLRDEGLWSDAK